MLMIKRGFYKFGNAMLIRVPYHVVPGQKVWAMIEPEFSDDGVWEIEEERVTEVRSRGLWVSGCRPSADDFGCFFSWDKIGKEVFLSRDEAEKALKKEKKENE